MLQISVDIDEKRHTSEKAGSIQHFVDVPEKYQKA